MFVNIHHLPAFIRSKIPRIVTFYVPLNKKMQKYSLASLMLKPIENYEPVIRATKDLRTKMLRSSAVRKALRKVYGKYSNLDSAKK